MINQLWRYVSHCGALVFAGVTVAVSPLFRAQRHQAVLTTRLRLIVGVQVLWSLCWIFGDRLPEVCKLSLEEFCLPSVTQVSPASLEFAFECFTLACWCQSYNHRPLIMPFSVEAWQVINTQVGFGQRPLRDTDFDFVREYALLALAHFFMVSAVPRRSSGKCIPIDNTAVGLLSSSIQLLLKI